MLTKPPFWDQLDVPTAQFRLEQEEMFLGNLYPPGTIVDVGLKRNEKGQLRDHVCINSCELPYQPYKKEVGPFRVIFAEARRLRPRSEKTDSCPFGCKGEARRSPSSLYRRPVLEIKANCRDFAIVPQGTPLSKTGHYLLLRGRAGDFPCTPQMLNTSFLAGLSEIISKNPSWLGFWNDIEPPAGGTVNHQHAQLIHGVETNLIARLTAFPAIPDTFQVLREWPAKGMVFHRQDIDLVMQAVTRSHDAGFPVNLVVLQEVILVFPRRLYREVEDFGQYPASLELLGFYVVVDESLYANFEESSIRRILENTTLSTRDIERLFSLRC